MALRIARDPEAFSRQPTGKGSKRVKDPSYLDWLHTLPCVVTGSMPVEAAHVSYPDPDRGKTGRGKGSKESDRWALPLCPEEHRRQHSMNEREYWRNVGIDPVITAALLYAAYPSTERAMLVINSLRKGRGTLWQPGEARDHE